MELIAGALLTSLLGVLTLILRRIAMRVEDLEKKVLYKEDFQSLVKDKLEPLKLKDEVLNDQLKRLEILLGKLEDKIDKL